MTDIRVVIMTAPSARTAKSIVDALLADGLIACGTITMPVRSHYLWQGGVERANEVLVIIKTTEASIEQVTRRIAELHPYDVPEVLALPVLGGHDAYLRWVRESVSAD